ncbi:hypothetical protein [Methylocystis echinoides]|uniref:hypothetical protein n=1 Tax=Methylocystis echinoides TaxID=29468 RepID=UPI00341CF099
MQNRKDRLARAKSIGDKLWRLQQMRLSAAERELAAVQAREAAAFDSLDRLEPSLILPHIAELAKARREAEAALADAQARARDYGRRAKLTGKLHKEATERAQREEAEALLRSAAIRGDVDVSVE